jgi:hypothetical protein
MAITGVVDSRIVGKLVKLIFNKNPEYRPPLDQATKKPRVAVGEHPAWLSQPRKPNNAVRAV